MAIICLERYIAYGPRKLDLAKKVKEGCQQEDLVGFMYSTVGVRCVKLVSARACGALRNDLNDSDGITMASGGTSQLSLTSNSLPYLRAISQECCSRTQKL